MNVFSSYRPMKIQRYTEITITPATAGAPGTFWSVQALGKDGISYYLSCANEATANQAAVYMQWLSDQATSNSIAI